MLRYTGHPIADIGGATIAAFCEKTDPDSLTEKDLVKMAGFLEKEYFSGKLLSYLTCVFPNSAYVQPGAQPGGEDKKGKTGEAAFQKIRSCGDRASVDEPHQALMRYPTSRIPEIGS